MPAPPPLRPHRSPPNHKVGARGAGSGERGRTRSRGPAAPTSLASLVTRRLPNHEGTARGVGSGERGRARSSGLAAPASLSSPIACLLPSYKVGARRAATPPTDSRSSAFATATSTSSSASTSHNCCLFACTTTGVCVDDEGADAQEVVCGVIKKENGELPQTVQHDHLVDTSVIDITTADLVVNSLHYIFPNFDYR
ncbi:hypothetical protein ACQJBY_060402 [Aegilops geniculata]